LIARLPLSGVVDIRLCELGLVEPRVDLMSYVYDGNGNGVSKTVRGDRAVLFDMLPPPRKMRYSYTLLRVLGSRSNTRVEHAAPAVIKT